MVGLMSDTSVEVAKENKAPEFKERLSGLYEQVTLGKIGQDEFCRIVEGLLSGQSADLKAKLAEAERLANTDLLSGLYNLRGFEKSAEQALASAERSNTPGCLLAVDLDKFKTFNDTHGHPSGDKMIGLIGQVLQKSLRTSDIAARVGGDEFAVYLPGTDLKGAAVVAAKLKQEIAQQSQLAMPGLGWIQTVSIGSAFYDPNASESLRLLRSRADVSLYEDKATKSLKTS